MFLEYLEDLGYSDVEIKTISKSVSINPLTDSNLLYNIKSIYKFFSNNGISNNDFKNITLTIPFIISTSLENIKSIIKEYKSLGFSNTNIFAMIKEYPYLLEFPVSTIKTKYDSLLELGFSKDNLVDIISNYPSILRKDNSTLKKRINIYLNYGFSMEQVVKIHCLYPSLFEIQSNMIKNKILSLEKHGFNNSDIISLISYNPKLLLEDDFINTYFSYLIRYGYTELDIINIMKKIPFIINERIKERINYNIKVLENIGFTRDNILLVTSNNPYLFLYSSDDFSSKINYFLDLKYDKDKVINLFLKAPVLFGYNLNTLKIKFDFYKENDLVDYIFDNPNKSIINTNFLNKRLSYLKNNNLYDDNKYDLFLDDISFNKKYKITRYELEEL